MLKRKKKKEARVKQRVFKYIGIPALVQTFFKAIILKSVYAAGAFLLHIKIIEKQEKEINASLEINNYWHSLGSLTMVPLPLSIFTKACVYFEVKI